MRYWPISVHAGVPIHCHGAFMHHVKSVSLYVHLPLLAGTFLREHIL